MFAEEGAFIITAAAKHKVHVFDCNHLLEFLTATLLEETHKDGWELHAWAVLSNHYHFVGRCSDPIKMPATIRKIHSITAIEANKYSGKPGREVWYQYWDSAITFERSWLARIKYVSENPVKHGVAKRAVDYPYCSAAWMACRFESEFAKSIDSFDTGLLEIADAY